MSVTVWLIISGVFLVMEFCTFEFVLGWFCVSGLVALLLSIFGLPVWAQAMAFIGLGILLMVGLRRPVLNLFLRHKHKTKGKKKVKKEDKK